MTPCQIETQTAALRAPRQRIVHAIEPFEDAALFIQRNADALIGHVTIASFGPTRPAT